MTTEDDIDRIAWVLVNEMVATADLTEEQVSHAMAWPEWIADAMLKLVKDVREGKA